MDDADDRLVCGFGVEGPDLVGKTAQEDTKEAAARGSRQRPGPGLCRWHHNHPDDYGLEPTRLTLTVEDRIVVIAVFG